MKIECEHCGGMRDENRSIRCPQCNSRKYFFVGYLYPTEVRSVQILFICIGIILLLALAAGLVYLISIYGHLY